MQDIQQYWPLAAVACWFAFKAWRARRVVAMLPQLKAQGACLVDVRSVAEFAQASAPDTLNIPLDSLGTRLAELPRDRPVVLACASGTRSGMARMLLKKHGYTQLYNIGNWRNFMR